MTGRVDQASRVIDAPASTLFRAFENPRSLESWLPPKGMRGHIEAFDFQDGGFYRMRLTYQHADRPRGKTSEDADVVEVAFVRLIRDRSIEQEVTFESDDPRFSGVMKMIWTFLPSALGTEVTVRCENVPEGIRREDHQAGLSDSLENLERFVGSGVGR